VITVVEWLDESF